MVELPTTYVIVSLLIRILRPQTQLTACTNIMPGSHFMNGPYANVAIVVEDFDNSWPGFVTKYSHFTREISDGRWRL